MTTHSVTSVLLVEDNAGDARLFREMLAEPGAPRLDVEAVECLLDAERFLTSHAVDAILLDLGLPDAQGLEAVRATAPRIPLVVLTGLDDEALATAALKAGAQDYLIKGQIDGRGLSRALRYAIERKAMKEALYVEQERAQVTLGCIVEGVICTDAIGRITFLNRAAEKMTGWHSCDATGLPIDDVFRMLGATALEAEPGSRSLASSRSSTEGGRRRDDCILLRRDGAETPVEESVAPIHDRQGVPTGTVVVFRDVSAARAMARQMVHAAEHDYLTGLPNRMLLDDRIGQAIALGRRHGKQLALLYLDLDGFKHINDSLGHATGDRLLQSVAARLVSCARASDTVSRLGGDEFVVLLSEVAHAENAAVAAKRLLDAVAKPHVVDDYELHVSTSIGVSVYPDDGNDARMLIQNADTAMYQAKASGRSNFRFFEPAMNARAVERQAIEEGLRRALERDELSLAYQPKIDFKTGSITGAEALLRWTHPTRGPISPAQFIPIAEDSGLIVPIGRWVLKRACEQAQAWVTGGLPLGTMAVNVSATEFRNDDFLDGLFGALADSGFAPGSLELELTETVLMQRAESTTAILETLTESGVRLAVDDFGTGYSSLSYLRKFPIHTLKIDRSFVHEIASGGDDATIVTAVIGMARSLDLKVVAEGVETRGERDFLFAHDCDEAQGFYFSHPVSPMQFERLLETGIAPALIA